MRSDVFGRVLGFGLIAALGVLGCSGDTTGDGGGDDETEGETSGSSGGPGPSTVAPEFPAGSGQQPNTLTQVAYPPGPYGIGKGSTIANYQFVGFVNAMVNSQSMQLLQLADFYNPTGTDVYPPGSPYGEGQPKPKALAIIVAAGWCAPCKQEAKSILPGKYLQYKPRKGEFFLQMADSPTPGKPAEPKHLYNWTQTYDVNYPSSIDPSYKLMALFESDAFPSNIIVDTTTMKIVEAIAGSPDAIYWKKFEALLDP